MAARIVDLGFIVADADRLTLSYEGEDLILRFRDWQERSVTVCFTETVAFSWQRAEEVAEDERFDSTHVIDDSPWLAEHVRQQEASADHQHLKLNFNAAGQLQIVCRDVLVS